MTEAKKHKIPEEILKRAKNTVAYHPFTDEQKERSERIRAAAASLIAEIQVNADTGPDKSAAIRKVREAVMTANAAIALRGTAPMSD